jgi:hypothetical protein
MTALEKLKKTFDELGIFYVEEIGGFQIEFNEECQYINIYLANEEEAKNNKLDNPFSRQLFEFRNGELASY